MQRNNATGAPDPIDVAVGARVRLRRQALRLSQTQLADYIGITFQQIQKYERGANRVSASALVKVAAKLQTSVAALVGEDGTEGVSPIIMAELATPGAADLLAAYARANTQARQGLLAVAQAAAVHAPVGAS